MSSDRSSPFEISEEGREKRQSGADQPSPISIPSNRSSGSFSFSQPPAPFTTSTPVQQSGQSGARRTSPTTPDRPTLSPIRGGQSGAGEESIDFPGRPVDPQYRQYIRNIILPPKRRGNWGVISSHTHSGRGRSSAISSPPVIEQFLNPERSGAGRTPPAVHEERSLSPIRRSGASSSDVFSGRGRSGAISTPPVNEQLVEQFMNPSGSQGETSSPLPVQRHRSSAITGQSYVVPKELPPERSHELEESISIPEVVVDPQPYTEQHQSEEHLPVQAVADWQSVYSSWEQLGEQYLEDIPQDEPLTAEEKQFALRHGIKFEKQLGKGAYGTVWLVLASKLFRDPDDPQKYIEKRLACKVLSLTKFKAPGDDPKVSVKKMLREADLHSTLNHRNIVKCEHVFHIHDTKTGFPHVRLLMFLELCDGDVKGMLDTKKLFSEREAMDMMNDVCQGLQYMHDQNICHLDIKIHNIMYVKEGGDQYCYKLADFGVSKRYVTEDKAKIFGRTGTTGYMAPELTRMPKGWSECKPADIYSLGYVLAEVLTGKGSLKELFPDLEKPRLQAYLSKKWKVRMSCLHLIKKMIDKDPKKRPTIAQVSQDPWFSNK